MQSAEEPQQSAELRQAFLRHLPKRVDVLRRRGIRLCNEGWDIHTLDMLYRDTQALAGASGKYGVLDVSEQLYALELLLERCVRDGQLPDHETSRRVADLLTRFVQPISSSDPPPDTEVHAQPPPARVDPSGGIATQRLAPPHYWRRFAADAEPPVLLRRSTAKSKGVVGGPAPSRRPAPSPHNAHATPVKHVLVLSDDSTPMTALIELLVAEGHRVDIAKSTAEFIEILGALIPNLIVLGARLEEHLDTLVEQVRTVRKKSGRRLALMTLAESGALPARLRVMRAGADACVPLNFEPQQMMEQVRQLLDVERDGPFRILIVEDDRSQALFAESILRNAGMETRAETDPLRVLAVLDDFHPDLILMDLYMPNVDGMELTAIIREREPFVSTPIVFLSGEQDQDKHFAALDAGGDDFLAKPIRPKHLISAVTSRVRRARASHRRLHQRDLRDPITGLYERTYLLDQLSATLTDGPSNSGGMLFIEIDNAPALRERLTLAVYEQLSTQAGALVAEHLEEDELGARFSDRSYILLCPQRSEAELDALARGILEHFREHLFVLGGQSLGVPISIGICDLSLGFVDAGAVLTAAERACRLAHDDKRKFLHHQPITPPHIKDERALSAAIGTALREDGFELLFQPILPVQGDADQLYQVLLRLRDTTGKLRPASELVPVAERHGNIVEVDRWVLSRALRTIDERQRAGAPVTLFVSQSLQSLLQPDQVNWMTQALDARQLSGEHLVIEFKPTQVQDNLREVTEFCTTLGARGVRFCLSSFEHASSALHLLERLPTHWVKVHLKYVGKQPEALSLQTELHGIVDRCHALGRQVIAPHVEDAGGAAAIWAAGVDYIQGNFVQGAGDRLEFDFQAAI